MSVLIALIVIGVIAAVVISLASHVQKTERAKEKLDDAIRDGNRTIALYNRMRSTPSPTKRPALPNREIS